VKSEAIAEEARRRNDDAVRRLREESRQRVARRTPGMSVCMLGMMVSMLLFLSLETRRQCAIAQAQNAETDAAERACANYARRRAKIEAVRREVIASSWFSDEDLRRIDDQTRTALEMARGYAVEKGCMVPPLPPPAPATPPGVFPVSDVWIVY
jgi:hypothetical protein